MWTQNDTCRHLVINVSNVVVVIDSQGESQLPSEADCARVGALALVETMRLESGLG